MAEVIHERESDSSATGIIAGILIVLMVLALIWFFGLRPSSNTETPSEGGANINVTIPSGGENNSPGGSGGGGNTGSY